MALFSRSNEYQRVLESPEGCFTNPSPSPHVQKEQTWLSRHAVLLTCAYAVPALWMIWTSFSTLSPPTLAACSSSASLPYYTPVESILEYEHVQFDIDFTSPNIFMGTNTPATVEAWRNLVQKGPAKIDAEQAAQLAGETAEWIGEPNTYLVGLEMFHQLHCLNLMRHAIWEEHPYVFHGKDGQGNARVDHMMHCIEYLRLSLLCVGDVSVTPTSRTDTWYSDNYDGQRTCHNLEPIRRWMDERSIEDSPEFKTYIETLVTLPGQEFLLPLNRTD